jgi:hypothetical protein
MESVPLGAPVRINVELRNLTNETIFAPKTLSMKSGLLRGKVTDPAGTVRTFSPVVLCVEDDCVGPLKPNESIRHSLTLLRGAQGALFPTPGIYQITVEVHWERETVELVVSGETVVMVSTPVDEAHTQAALKILSTPDTLLVLALGGDHLTAGIEAIQTATKNPVLRPHYAYIEAKRLGERFGKRKANLQAASELIDDSTVMSPAEIKRAAGLVKAESAESEPRKRIGKVLKSKTRNLNVGDDIKELVDSL